MPVYLFTFHAYLSWLPDRDEGYVRQNEGRFDKDVELGDLYSRNAKHDGMIFDRQIQSILIDEVIIACKFQDHRLHAVATDASHIHVLVSWKSEDPPLKVRAKIKSSLSRRLRQALSDIAQDDKVSPTFSRHGSSSCVRDKEHFDHLVRIYLPSHGGEKWFESGAM